MIRDREELWMFGRQVASRRSRDDRVRLGEGAIVVQGGFPNSGGSGRYPMLEVFVGTVLEIRDVSRALAEKEAEINPGIVEIIDLINA